jgi:3-hydroxyisobutyrate dehydrogenase
MDIALLGIGRMGEHMAHRLLDAGHTVIAWNRTRSKAERVGERGAQVVDRPEEAIRQAQVAILMLADAPAIEDVLLQENVLEHVRGRTVIQMGTIAPEESVAIGERVVEAGGGYLEAPVLGSVPHVQEGRLKVLVGGEADAHKRWEALLELFGSVFYIGHVGSAAAMKLARNQLIASLISAYALSLAVLEAGGLSVKRFMDVLRQDALFAPILDKKLPAMMGEDYRQASFAIKHLLKDVDLFLALARRHTLDTSPVEGVRSILEKAIDQGWGEADYAAIYGAVRR